MATMVSQTMTVAMTASTTIIEQLRFGTHHKIGMPTGMVESQIPTMAFKSRKCRKKFTYFVENFSGLRYRAP